MAPQDHAVGVGRGVFLGIGPYPAHTLDGYGRLGGVVGFNDMLGAVGLNLVEADGVGGAARNVVDEQRAVDNVGGCGFHLGEVVFVVDVAKIVGCHHIYEHRACLA